MGKLTPMGITQFTYGGTRACSNIGTILSVYLCITNEPITSADVIRRWIVYGCYEWMEKSPNTLINELVMDTYKRSPVSRQHIQPVAEYQGFMFNLGQFNKKQLELIEKFSEHNEYIQIGISPVLKMCTEICMGGWGSSLSIQNKNIPPEYRHHRTVNHNCMSTDRVCFTFTRGGATFVVGCRRVPTTSANSNGLSQRIEYNIIDSHSRNLTWDGVSSVNESVWFQTESIDEAQKFIEMLSRPCTHINDLIQVNRDIVKNPGDATYSVVIFIPTGSEKYTHSNMNSLSGASLSSYHRINTQASNLYDKVNEYLTDGYVGDHSRNNRTNNRGAEISGKSTATGHRNIEVSILEDNSVFRKLISIDDPLFGSENNNIPQTVNRFTNCQSYNNHDLIVRKILSLGDGNTTDSKSDDSSSGLTGNNTGSDPVKQSGASAALSDTPLSVPTLPDFISSTISDEHYYRAILNSIGIGDD